MADFSAKITITAVDKVSAVTKKISSSLNNLFNTSIKSRAMGFGQSLNNLSTATSNFGSRLRGTVIEAGAVAGSFYYITKRAGEMGEEMLNAAQKAGVAVDQLQKLRYAAKIGGVEVGDMDTALKFLNKSIAEAGTNKKSEHAKAFKSMGISVRDAKGEMKSASDVLLEMSDKFKKAPDGAKKVTTAFTLMGRSGTTMIPILNQGSQNFKEMAAEAERLNIILSEDEAKKLDNYGDGLQKLEASVGGLKNRIILALLPALTSLSNGMLDYFTENQKVLSQNISEHIKKFGEGLVEAWKGLRAVLDVITPVISSLGGIKTVVIALSTLYLSGLIISFGNVVIAIAAVTKAFALLSVAFLANPFGVIIAALGLIAIGAYKLYKIWPDLKKIFIESVNAMANALITFGQSIANFFAPILPGFNLILALINKIKGALSSLPSPNVNIGVTTSQQQAPQGQVAGPRFAPASQAASMTSVSPGLTANPAQTGRFGMIQSQQQKQRLDISMKIDSEGRPKDVSAKSNAPINFKANTGLVMP